MKIRTVIVSALATVSLASSAWAADGDAGAGGMSSEPYFEDVTSTSFPPPPCGDRRNPESLGCYTNFLVISDLDSDGDLDVAFANGGEYYKPDLLGKTGEIVASGLEPSTVYFNDGKGAFRDATEDSFGGPMSRLRQVAIGDVDGDGDLDLYQPGGYGIDDDKLFIQTKPGKFVDQATSRLPGGLRSRAGSAHFGDLDNDGDLDLVVGDWGVKPRVSQGNTFVYLNDGTGVFSALPLSVVPPPIETEVGSAPIDIDLADIDGDFDLDILIDHRDGQSRIFLNDGKAKFSDATENYPEKKGPYTYNVEACDFDEDGDLDLLLDNAGDSIVTEDNPDTKDVDESFFGNISQVLVNDGKGKFEDQTAERIKGEPYFDDNAVKCADIDGDGHYDLVVASLYGYGAQRAAEKLLLNDGTAHFTYVDKAFPAIEDPTLGIDIGDLDGDKKPDVITGQGEGTPRLDLVYKGLFGEDVTPPKFRAVEIPTASPGAPIVFRLAVTDGYTSETGEEVKSVFVSYTVNGGRAETAPGVFVGGDLFRVVIPAQAAGAVLSITPTAVDRVDLEGTATPFDLTVGMAGEGGAGGESAGGATGEPPTGTAGSAAAGEGGSGGEVTALAVKDDDDCGCSVVGAPRSSVPLLAGLGLAYLALRRRRHVKH